MEVLSELQCKDGRGTAMNDNERALIVCNMKEAIQLTHEDQNIIDSLVITSLISDGEAVMVSYNDFMTWLKGVEP